jgi:hypothetical protein
MKTLQMVFKNENGKNVTINVADAKDSLTSTEVKAAMQNIIAKNVFVSTGGKLVSAESAQLVDRQTAELTIK